MCATFECQPLLSSTQAFVNNHALPIHFCCLGNLLSRVLGLDGDVPWADLQPHIAPDVVCLSLLQVPESFHFLTRSHGTLFSRLGGSKGQEARAVGALFRQVRSQIASQLDAEDCWGSCWFKVRGVSVASAMT